MDTSMTGGRSMSSAIAIPWGSAANPNPPPSSRKEPVMVLTGTSGTTRGSSETRPDTGGPRSRVNAERLGLDWMPRTWGMVGSYASYQAMSSWTSIRSPSATPSRSAWPAAYLFAVAVTAFPSASLITSVPAVSAAPAMTLTIGPIWTPRSFAVTAPLATSEPRAPHISSPAPQRARSALVVLTNRHGLADRSAVVCRVIHWVLLAVMAFSGQTVAEREEGAASWRRARTRAGCSPVLAASALARSVMARTGSATGSWAGGPRGRAR